MIMLNELGKPRSCMYLIEGVIKSADGKEYKYFYEYDMRDSTRIFDFYGHAPQGWDDRDEERLEQVCRNKIEALIRKHESVDKSL